MCHSFLNHPFQVTEMMSVWSPKTYSSSGFVKGSGSRVSGGEVVKGAGCEVRGFRV